MKKQLIAAATAAVLAVVGVVVLVGYAQGANDRAFAGARLVKVLQVQIDVPANTPADRLAGSVKLVKVPLTAKVKGALTSLDSVKSLSTNVAFKEGEQVLGSRFGSLKVDKPKPGGLPDGFQEISITASGPQSVGGQLKVGNRVGIIASYDGETNFLSQQRILVTRISKSAVAGADGSAGGALVTLAVKTVDAEKIAHASEFGKIWLTLQDGNTDTGGRTAITKKDVMK